MTDKKALWNDAGKDGLILGAISLFYMACNFLLGKVGEGSAMVAILASLIGFVLWAVKFGACIYLMKFFMKTFAKANPGVDNSDSFKFGCAVALLSALIYSAGYLAYVTFLEPDIFSKSIEMFADNPMMTSDTMEVMEQMVPKLPRFGFFFNLIYCYIFGSALAAIFSRSIPSTNPFAGEDDVSGDED